MPDEPKMLETTGVAPDAPEGAVFDCASCGHSQNLPEELLGRQARCPLCRQLGLVERPGVHLREPDERDVSLDDMAGDDSAAARPRGHAVPSSKDSLALDPIQRPESTLDHLRFFFSGNPALNVLAGLLGGVQLSLVCLALSLLVFSVPGLSAVFPHALHLTLFPALLASVLFALQGRLPVALGGPGPATTLCVLLLVATVGADLAGHASAQVVSATMLAALALASAFTGALCVLFARLGLAERIRFLPTEVFGGMLAGFGLLLLKAWFLVLASGSPALAGLFQGHISQAGALLLSSANIWAPPVGFGLAYFLLRTVIKGLFWPLAFVVLTIAAWNAALLQGGSLGLWAARLPHLPGLLDMNGYVAMFDVDSLRRIDWPALAGRKEFFALVAAVAIVPTLVRTSILEAVLAHDADSDGQLPLLGGASMLSGLLGGLPATLSLSGSLGLRSLGATAPLAGFTAGLVCLGFALRGQGLLAHIPLFVPLGLLLATGLSMPVGWMLRDNKNPLSGKHEQRTAWVACLLTVVLGPLLGVFSCLVLGLAMALARAVGGGGIKLIQSGDVFHSSVDRSPAERRILRERGGQILVLRLHGFLFLGTLHGLLRILRERMDGVGQGELRYALLDFGAVSGLGGPALHGFRRLEQLARKRGFLLCFTSVPLELEEHLEALGYRLGEEHGLCRIYLNLDYALESCEDSILVEAGGLEQRQDTLEELLAATFPDPQLVPTLMKCLERMEVKKKSLVIRQGDESDSMYFLQSGRVRVELALPGGRLLRLKKMGPGTVFGEMGLYTSAPRSASVIASERCVLYRLSAERFRLIQAKAPQLASAVNRFIVTLLAERLAEANAKARAAQL